MKRQQSASTRSIATVAVVAFAFAMAAGIGIGIWNNYASTRYDASQDVSRITFQRTVDVRFNQTDTRITALNTSLCAKIMALNVTTTNCSLLLELYIIGNTSDAIAFADQRILTINGLHAENTTGNFDIVAPTGSGLSIAPNGPHGIDVVNTGVHMLFAGDGISLDVGSGNVTVTNTGVLSVQTGSGVIEPDAMGHVNVVGENGVTVTGNATTHTVVASALELAMAIANLAEMVSIQSMIITNLTSRIETIEYRLDSIELIGSLIAIDVNGTDIYVNHTVMDLIIRIMWLESEVINLQLLLANASSSRLAPGTLVVWSGAANDTIPAGYLYCDGSVFAVPLSMADPYFELFMAIGTTYCAEVSCAPMQFAVPDLRGKLAVGENMAPGSVFGTMGTAHGEETHTLTEMEMPMHTHVSNNPSTGIVKTTVQLANPGASIGTTTGTVNTFGQQSSLENTPGTSLFGSNKCPGTGLYPTEAPPLFQTNMSVFPEGWLSSYCAPTATCSGLCNCDPVNAYQYGLAIRAYVSNPNPQVSCTALQFNSDNYAHTHPNDPTGGSASHNNVQPSLTVGGYLIKT